MLAASYAVLSQRLLPMNPFRTLAVLLLAATATAQPAVERTPLQKLHEAFQQKRMQLVRDGAGFEAQRRATMEFTEELEEFLGRASGLDRINGRLMLVDYHLSLGNRDKAIATLTELDPDDSPALALTGAAEFAGHLGLVDKRNAWIDAAISKKESFENRMALGMHLMTRLGEIDKGEKIFADAMAAAKDEASRAKVAWFHIHALREREDLPEGTYDEKLEELAKAYPDTYYGKVATDRIAARGLKVGADAIQVAMTTIDGRAIAPSQLEGKVVLLEFWSSWCGPCRQSAKQFAALHADYADRGLVMIGISMDEKVEDARRAIAQDGRDWLQVCDGRGMQADAALRWSVDLPPRMVLIGRDGKIAAMQLFPFSEEGLAETRGAIEAAL